MSQGMKSIKEFAEEAKFMGGSDLQELIKQVLNINNVFSFGELLLVPTVQQLRESEHAIALSTLELFAYGSLRDYTSNPENFFALSDSQVYRLKLLTLVSLAYHHKQLSYTVLHKELDTTSSRELEDVVIEAVFHGLLSAKIDQKNEILRISSCTGRDITPNDMVDMLNCISSWRSNCVQLISSIQDSSGHIAGQRVAASEQTSQLHDSVAQGLKEMLTRDGGFRSVSSGSGSAGGMFGGSSIRMGRARPKRSRGHHSVSIPPR
mmetsp:Transcript_6684/g.12876  ORF Transcript_6684/g.12876 Transcript_6684/m.12876 type:complete len:264 (+) Transcript_6684:76-867(+)